MRKGTRHTASVKAKIGESLKRYWKQSKVGRKARQGNFLFAQAKNRLGAKANHRTRQVVSGVGTIISAHRSGRDGIPGLGHRRPSPEVLDRAKARGRAMIAGKAAPLKKRTAYHIKPFSDVHKVK